MPVFFLSSDQIRNRLVTITGPLLRHLRTSMRYQPGDELWVGDDRRKRYRVKVGHVDARELRGDVMEEVMGPPSGRQLVLGQALLKGERMEWVIQKATELGIDRLVPLITGHTVVRPKAGRIDTQQQRWQRIALEAAQQSERWDVPHVERPQVVREFFAASGFADVRLILVEPSGASPKPQESLSSVPLGSGPIVVAIGPEGGWREEELASSTEYAFGRVGLGARVLRAETAALAALAVLQSRLGELG